MTIRDAYLLSGSQWDDILFEGEFLIVIHVKLCVYLFIYDLIHERGYGQKGR